MFIGIVIYFCILLKYSKHPRGGAFALFLCPHHGAFGSLSASTPGNLSSKKKGGGRGAWTQLKISQRYQANPETHKTDDHYIWYFTFFNKSKSSHNFAFLFFSSFTLCNKNIHGNCNHKQSWLRQTTQSICYTKFV